jgi:uncharacterized protein (TIGR02453 family)
MYSASTLEFLKGLKANNNKSWFETNRKSYESAREEHIANVEQIIGIISQWDDNLKGLDPRKCIFRINRDIRFSKDKSPYKTNFGAYFSPQREDWSRAGYYLHIEPGANFIAGGVYSPGPDHLRRIRQEIDYNLDEFTGILNNSEFSGWWGTELGGEKLKKAPKDYPSDHQGIEYLKQKDFIVRRKISDKELTGKDLKKTLNSAFEALYTLNQFFDRVWD